MLPVRAAYTGDHRGRFLIVRAYSKPFFGSSLKWGFAASAKVAFFARLGSTPVPSSDN